jgi:hypothetical protein
MSSNLDDTSSNYKIRISKHSYAIALPKDLQMKAGLPLIARDDRRTEITVASIQPTFRSLNVQSPTRSR